MRTIIFDAGHGGVIDGKYQTAGKRSPIWKDGRQLFEGVFNRKIVNLLKLMCIKNEIPFLDITTSLEDIPLKERVKTANTYYKETNKDCIYISIHANAGGGTGFEVFTSVGDTKSDEIAEIIIEEYKKGMPKLRLRKDTSDGDLDKEAHFQVLRKTFMPAILIECAFMDTLEPDCEYMMCEYGRQMIALAIFNGIKKIV